LASSFAFRASSSGGRARPAIAYHLDQVRDLTDDVGSLALQGTGLGLYFSSQASPLVVERGNEFGPGGPLASDGVIDLNEF
jgi:hypothetical protein